MHYKKQLLLIFGISFICLNLYAYNDQITDISEYPDNYSYVSLDDFSSEDVEFDSTTYTMTLPIKVHYSPNFPYEFILLNEDSEIGSIGNLTEGYQTSAVNIDDVQKTETFTLKVEGNELSKHEYDLFIDNQPTFYAKNNLELDSTIPITFTEDYIYNNSSRKVNFYNYYDSYVIHDGFPYFRNSYYVKLKKGYRNRTLLKFHYSWPKNASEMLPSGFENTHQVVAYVGITLTDLN
jgi:hypothetical protein